MKRVTVGLAPFPAHELEWLEKELHQPSKEIIKDALIHYAALWRKWIGERSQNEAEVGQNLGRRMSDRDN